jgi:hypothetical protein
VGALVRSKQVSSPAEVIKKGALGFFYGHLMTKRSFAQQNLPGDPQGHTESCRGPLTLYFHPRVRFGTPQEHLCPIPNSLRAASDGDSPFDLK